jgi:hypothetical protein
MNSYMNRSGVLACCLVLLGTISACDSHNAGAAATSSASSAAAKPAVASKQPASVVTKIVFVDKEHACDCTRKKVATAQAALAQVLGTPAKIPVETMKADTESDKLEPYRRQKPMMAVPAIYFVDEKNTVLQLLQGELTAEQVARAIETQKS